MAPTQNETWVKYLVWLLGAWFLALIFSYSSLMPRPYDDFKNGLLYLGSAAWGCWYFLQKRGQSFSLDSLSCAVAGYFMACLVSLCSNSSPAFEGWLALTRLLLWGLLAYLFSKLDERQWHRMAAICVLSAAFIAIMTWVRLTFYAAYIESGAGTIPFIWAKAYSGMPPIGNASYYSDFMMLQAPLAVYLILASATKRARLLWGGALFLVLAGLHFASTRSSFVALLTGLMIGGALAIKVYRQRSKKTALVVLAVAALIGFTFLRLPVDQSQRAIPLIDRMKPVWAARSLEDLASLSPGRWDNYRTSILMSRQHPLIGWGVGSFRFIYPEFSQVLKEDPSVNHQTWFMHPHNEVLNQLVEVGWLGASLWILVILLFGHRVWRFLSSEGVDQGQKRIALLCAAGLLMSLVSWQMNTNYLFPLSRLMTAFYVGALLRLTGLLSLKPLFRLNRKLRFGLVALMAMIGLFIASYHLSLYYQTRSMFAGERAKALHFSRLSQSLAPGAFDPLYIRTVSEYQADSPTASHYMNALYEEFPFVPLVLYVKASHAAGEGDFGTAKSLLTHALKNDPTFALARHLLDRLP